MVEDEQLEFKASPYQLKDEKQKMELAKDVSSFANAGGGIILVGVESEKVQERQSEKAIRIRPFAEEHCNRQQLADVLNGWIYPPVRNIVYAWHPSKADPVRGISSISIAEAAAQDKPYVVAKVLDQTGREFGALMGYFERLGSVTPPMSVQQLRDKIKDGLRFGQIDERLRSIEETLAQRATTSELPRAALQQDVVDYRINQAHNAAGLGTGPAYSLAAWSVEGSQFPDLFRSRDVAPAKLLENPPSHRAGGFDLSTRRPSEIIEGRLRRCLIPRSKLLELWQDGFLITVEAGDAWGLAWAMGSDETTGLRINNIALAEKTFLFSELTIQMFQLADPRPKRVKMRLTFSGMRFGPRLMCLSPFRPNQFNLTSGWREAKNDGAAFDIEFQLAGVQPGVVAYSLLAKVYTWFGLEETEIPYVNAESKPRTIDYNLVVGSAAHA